MNHPIELLADLVDGTLDERAFPGVQAHLDACAACRGDLAAARAGAEAARSLPLAPAPADLHRRVIEASGGGRGTPSWYRWAGVAAAAAVVAVIALALPNVGDGGNVAGNGDAATEQAPAADDAHGSLSADEVRIQVEDADYDPKALEALAENAAENAAGAPFGEASPIRTAADDDPAAAVRCVHRAFDGRPVGRLARLIQARFDGRDAYIAVYLEGPGAGQPPAIAAVWVASAEDCTVLSVASARISP
jgi:hypothetical protein